MSGKKAHILSGFNRGLLKWTQSVLFNKLQTYNDFGKFNLEWIQSLIQSEVKMCKKKIIKKSNKNNQSKQSALSTFATPMICAHFAAVEPLSFAFDHTVLSIPKTPKRSAVNEATRATEKKLN